MLTVRKKVSTEEYLTVELLENEIDQIALIGHLEAAFQKINNTIITKERVISKIYSHIVTQRRK